MDWGGYFKPVPVAGTDYHVKALTWAEMGEILALDTDAQRFRLVECSCCDADGKRRIADGEAGQLPAPLALRLFEAANRVNSLAEEAVEEAAGN